MFAILQVVLISMSHQQDALINQRIDTPAGETMQEFLERVQEEKFNREWDAYLSKTQN